MFEPEGDDTIVVVVALEIAVKSLPGVGGEVLSTRLAITDIAAAESVIS